MNVFPRTSYSCYLPHFGFMTPSASSHVPEAVEGFQKLNSRWCLWLLGLIVETITPIWFRPQRGAQSKIVWVHFSKNLLVETHKGGTTSTHLCWHRRNFMESEIVSIPHLLLLLWSHEIPSIFPFSDKSYSMCVKSSHSRCVIIFMKLWEKLILIDQQCSHKIVLLQL